MHVGGRPSWRFAEDTSSLAHGVLFVRDALRLPVDAISDIPPRLIGDVPDYRERLDGRSRQQAAVEWPRWWHAALAYEAQRSVEVSDSDAHERVRRLAAMRAVADPPQWTALEESPALRAAARLAYLDGCRWCDQHLQASIDAGRPAVFGPRVRRVAEQLSAVHDPATVHGAVSVLLVEGPWWRLVAPRFAICSLDAAKDPDTAETILEAVLRSPPQAST